MEGRGMNYKQLALLLTIVFLVITSLLLVFSILYDNLYDRLPTSPKPEEIVIDVSKFPTEEDYQMLFKLVLYNQMEIEKLKNEIESLRRELDLTVTRGITKDSLSTETGLLLQPQIIYKDCDECID
jgi:hypothetical protein